jgi:nucleotide-binding universal stress UspA family protein
MAENYSVNRILIPLDGSENGERALAWAKALAGTKGELVLMEVMPQATPVHTFGGTLVSTEEEIRAKYREVATAQLTDAKERWLPDARNVAIVVAEGDPVEQIIWTAADVKAGLIIMSSHGRGGLGRFTSGSVADRMMREAPLPVMIVGPESSAEKDQPISKVIAPVDGTPLSMSALPVAAAIAKQANVPVEVITVVKGSIEEMPPAYAGIPPAPGDFYEEAATENQRGGEGVVERALSELRSLGVEASGDAYYGNIAQTILDAIQPGDLLVLSSHGRSGLPRWVLGSTALRMIRSSPAPVTVVTREYLESQGTQT